LIQPDLLPDVPRKQRWPEIRIGRRMNRARRAVMTALCRICP